MSGMTLTDSMLTVIWKPGPHDSIWNAELLPELLEICKSSGNIIGEWLCGQRALQTFSKKELRNLERRLDSTRLRNTLRDVTMRARRFNGQLPMARIAIDMPRAPNPINPELYTAENLKASRVLIGALESAIRCDLNSFTPHARIGLLLLSGAYYGALLDIPQLNALIKLDSSDFVCVTGLPEARLRLSIRGQPDAEQRQWFPDPTTLALLSRCAPDLEDLRPEMARRDSKLRCIREVLLAVGMPVLSQPSTLERMFELLRIQLQTHQPQLLVRYCIRTGFVTHPVQADSWLQMYGDSAPNKGESFGSKKKQRHRRAAAEGPEWLKQLCRKVRKEQLAKVDPVPPPQNMESLISSWAARLVHGRSYYGTPLKPETIAAYIRDVGRGLVDMLCVESILEVHPDALEEIYEIMLEAQPTNSTRRNLAKGLVEFHNFLHKEFAFPPISPYAVLGVGKTHQTVDAQIITEDQYRRVLFDLAVGPLAQRSPKLVKVAQAMVIFGFRLGLRRNEALKLLRRDLQLPRVSEQLAAAVRRRHEHLRPLTPESLKALELPVILHIRPHSQRYLKTRNSTRTLPLHVLLEPEELKLIEDLAQQRDEEEKHPYSDYLFCVPELQTVWVSESSLLPAIHDSLRRITGCGERHFHHLRHSCATWLTFKLAVAAWGVAEQIELLFGQHAQTVAWLKNADRLVRCYFHSQEATTRKIMYIISAVLGHASPKTSLLHYVHCIPWLLALRWQWNPAHWPSSSVVAKIAQVSLPTKPEEGDFSGLPAEVLHMQRIIGRIRFYKRSRQLKKTRHRIHKRYVFEGFAMARIQQISAMLAYEAYAEATGKSVNLDWIEFPESDRVAMLHRARHIRSLGTHRLRGPTTDKRLDPVVLVPRPPKHGGLVGVAAYAEALYQLLAGSHRLKVNRILDDFVERCWATETTLRFYQDCDERCAREYLWLLSKLGIDLRHIEFITYDLMKPRQTKLFWRDALDLPNAKFVEQRPENPLVENGHIGLRVQLCVSKTASGQNETVNHHSGAALRYLFLMASIDWHDRF